MVHESECTQQEFDDYCGMFMQQGGDALSFLTPTDEMCKVACKSQVSQPCVIITSSHGGVSVSEGLHMFNARQRRRVSLVGIDQWAGMASVMRLIRKHGHRNVLFFAGPGQWRHAPDGMEQAVCAEHREFGDGAVRR